MNSNSTTKRRKPASTTGKLKLILVAGSLAATMIGADLLAARDEVPAIAVTVTAPTATTPANGVVIVIPEQQNRPSATLSNAPIPQLTIPRPVAVSKSSR